MRSRVTAWLVALLLLPQPAFAGDESRLVEAPGWRLVQAHCAACHSIRLVTAYRGDRDDWLALIRWMQATQNLWPLPAPIEAQILDYLAEHYGAAERSRRPPLPAELMPLPTDG